ncbi:hypothetical protein JSQ81_18240 [Sporosarcina sp. Marseille-Q4063]|uniref:hypothetical protein n=1 Tax=Sporosarcina sp. Marseille-Q4063 TaxID=2810514 RepID=UPI001BAFDA55|nr:hypothetical protein [Sporosarcina sp. Marseille-Q4063]QUW21698.1 hypothetical protein JSQ81_18240 [Sporosarcina sp. Marseille-Q4063]
MAIIIITVSYLVRTARCISGGFERPIDAVFDSDGVLYVLDFGLFAGASAVPGTGVIWKIRKTG